MLRKPDLNKRLYRILRRSLAKFGYQLNRIETLTGYTGQLFEMPIEHCYTGYGFAYQPNVGNPFVDHLYVDKSPDFFDSVFYRFASNYNPANAAEAFLPWSDEYPCLEQLLIDPRFSKFRVPNLPMFWSRNHQVRKYLQHQNQFDRGSNEERRLSKGEQHFSRSRRIFNKINSEGFRLINEETQPNHAFICGVLLKRDSDFRCVITSGQHRVGALSALGHTSVPVLINEQYAPIVDRASVRNWPIVVQGAYTEKAALAVFDRFFDDNGSSIARYYKLIPDYQQD